MLLFTLVASFYVTAWLRRWVAEEAGWGGVLLVLQPGVIQWSHAIMLNIPSMALSLAALYHTRRWLEDLPSRHVYLSASLALLTILAYMPAGVVMLVILAWIIAKQRWTVFQDRRVRCGCQWLAIARSSIPYQVDAIQHLYKALEGPEFQFVRSFPIVNYVPMGETFQAKPIEKK